KRGGNYAYDARKTPHFMPGSLKGARSEDAGAGGEEVIGVEPALHGSQPLPAVAKVPDPVRLAQRDRADRVVTAAKLAVPLAEAGTKRSSHGWGRCQTPMVSRSSTRSLTRSTQPR